MRDVSNDRMLLKRYSEEAEYRFGFAELTPRMTRTDECSCSGHGHTPKMAHAPKAQRTLTSMAG